MGNRVSVKDRMSSTRLAYVVAARANHRKFCRDRFCKGVDAPHGACADCGSSTSHRQLRIEEVTLKRKHPFVCDDCSTQTLFDATFKAQQEDLRRKRVELRARVYAETRGTETVLRRIERES